MKQSDKLTYFVELAGKDAIFIGIIKRRLVEKHVYLNISILTALILPASAKLGNKFEKLGDRG